LISWPTERKQALKYLIGMLFFGASVFLLYKYPLAGAATSSKRSSVANQGKMKQLIDKVRGGAGAHEKDQIENRCKMLLKKIQRMSVNNPSVITTETTDSTIDQNGIPFICQYKVDPAISGADASQSAANSARNTGTHHHLVHTTKSSS